MDLPEKISDIVKEGLKKEGLSGVVFIKKDGAESQNQEEIELIRELKSYLNDMGYPSMVKSCDEEYHIIYWRNN